MSALIERFGRNDDTAAVLKSILENGVAVIENLWDPDVMDRLTAKVDADLDAQERGGGETFGDGKRSACALFARDREFSEQLLLNEKILELADGVLLPERPMALSAPVKDRGGATLEDRREHYLAPRDHTVGPNCHHYRINASVAMQVVKGGDNQWLHRDSWRYAPYMRIDANGPQPTMAVMVAGTDFTADNGATRFVPGSNRWPEERKPLDEEVVQAVMPKGSAAFWLGSVLHGFGASRIDDPRTGLIFSYVVDRFTQEENQFLSVPPEIARSLPERAQQLLGYRSARVINFVEGYDADNLLNQGSSGPL